LDVLIVLALSGVLLTNPIGWAIAAGATLAGWVADTVIPAWNARKELKACEKKLENLQTQLLNPHLDQIKRNELESQIKNWQAKKEIANATYVEKKNKALWGVAAVVGMVMFACGPFGFAAIGLIGTAIFIGIAIKGAYDFVSSRAKAEKPILSAQIAEDKLNVESDFKDEKENLLEKKSSLTSSATLLASFTAKKVISTPKTADLAPVHVNDGEFVDAKTSLSATGKFAEQKSKIPEKEVSKEIKKTSVPTTQK
jgi:hypothetical protein